MGNGFVYLTRIGRYYKIGRTTNLDQRFANLGSRLRIVGEGAFSRVHEIGCADAEHVERYLHCRFHHRQVVITQEIGGRPVAMREFFALTADDVAYITSLDWDDVNALPELPETTPVVSVATEISADLDRRLRRYLAQHNGRKLTRADGRVSKKDIIERALTEYLERHHDESRRDPE